MAPRGSATAWAYAALLVLAVHAVAANDGFSSSSLRPAGHVSVCMYGEDCGRADGNLLPHSCVVRAVGECVELRDSRGVVTAVRVESCRASTGEWVASFAGSCAAVEHGVLLTGNSMAGRCDSHTYNVGVACDWARPVTPFIPHPLTDPAPRTSLDAAHVLPVGPTRAVAWASDYIVGADPAWSVYERHQLEDVITYMPAPEGGVAMAVVPFMGLVPGDEAAGRFETGSFALLGQERVFVVPSDVDDVWDSSRVVDEPFGGTSKVRGAMPLGRALVWTRAPASGAATLRSFGLSPHDATTQVLCEECAAWDDVRGGKSVVHEAWGDGEWWPSESMRRYVVWTSVAGAEGAVPKVTAHMLPLVDGESGAWSDDPLGEWRAGDVVEQVLAVPLQWMQGSGVVRVDVAALDVVFEGTIWGSDQLMPARLPGVLMLVLEASREGKKWSTSFRLHAGSMMADQGVFPDVTLFRDPEGHVPLVASNDDVMYGAIDPDPWCGPGGLMKPEGCLVLCRSGSSVSDIALPTPMRINATTVVWHTPSQLYPLLSVDDGDQWHTYVYQVRGGRLLELGHPYWPAACRVVQARRHFSIIYFACEGDWAVWSLALDPYTYEFTLRLAGASEQRDAVRSLAHYGSLLMVHTDWGTSVSSGLYGPASEATDAAVRDYLHTSSQRGSIIGGVLGGLAAVLLVVGGVWWVRTKRRMPWRGAQSGVTREHDENLSDDEMDNINMASMLPVPDVESMSLLGGGDADGLPAHATETSPVLTAPTPAFTRE